MENHRIQNPEANRDRKLKNLLTGVMAIGLLGACGPVNSQAVSREKTFDNKPAETSPANTPLPNPDMVTPTVFPLPTEIRPTLAPTATPEVIKIPDFAIRTETGYLDIGQTFYLKFNNNEYMDILAQPVTARTGDEIVELNNLYAANNSWKKAPELFGVIKSGFDQMFIGEIHSGEILRTIPATISKDDPTWLPRWMEVNPGKDPNAVQEVDMPGQIFVDKFNDGTLLGTEFTLQDINGSTGKLIVTDAKQINPEEFLNSNPPGEDAFIPLSKLVEGWSSPGITFVVCSDRNPTTKIYEKRLLIVTNLAEENSN